MQDIQEIWKDVVGYEGLYQVSNLGRVKSLEKINPHNGNVFKEKVLSQNKSRLYNQVRLSNKGLAKTLTVHRLVAKAFIPNPKNKPQVNHIDGDKRNNHVENLEWCTASENRVHALDNNLVNVPFGTSHHACKLTEKQVLEIRAKYAAGTHSQHKLMAEYGIARGSVIRILKRKVWKHI